MNKLFLCSDKFSCNSISNFTIEITQRCNFRCKYCCYSGNYSGMRTHSDKSMSKETIIDSIEFIKKHAHSEDQIVVSFFGGEALLEIDRIVFIIESLNAFFGERISYDVSTNGLLLTDDIIKRLLKYDIGISVSLDGCQEIHDKNRVLPSGDGTFVNVVNNLLHFKKSYAGEYSKRIRILITAGSIEDVIVMNNYFDKFEELLGDKPLFISHIYPNFKKGLLYEDDIYFKKRFLDKAVEHKKRGIYDLYTIMLDDLLKHANKRFDDDCALSRVNLHTCLNNMYSIFIDVSGNLGPCEKFDTYHYIGNVKSGINKTLLQKYAYSYCIRKNILCGSCDYIEYCKRCLADLKMSLSEQRQMCKIYQENINLAKIYKLRINDV